MESSKQVGIWIRVSTMDLAKGDSPANHERRARLYAESKGWEVVELYDLSAVSGKTVINTTQGKKMMNDIKRGHITGLIFTRLARLGRNTKELLEIADFFELHQADLICLAQSIDTSTPSGRMFYTIIGAFAQYEREQASDRVADSIPFRAEKGKPLGGQASFGFQWVDKRFELHPEEAPIRKLMFELFLEIKKISTVATELNDRGHRTRKGSKWSATSVRRLLRDTTAKGERIANYTKSNDKKKNWILKPKEDWIITPCPRIVSDEVFNQCQVILDDIYKKNKKSPKRASHLFTGLVFCHCGGRMYVRLGRKVTTPKYVCVMCKNKIGEVDLEDIFYTQLQGFLFSEIDLPTYFNQSENLIKDKEAILHNQQQEIRKIQLRLEKLIELYNDDELPKEGFRHHYEPLFEQLTQIQKQIPELEAEIDFLKIQQISSNQVIEDARQLHGQWTNLSFKEKRTIVENTVDRVAIGESDISINLAYLPTSFPATPSFESVADSERNLRDSLKQST